MSRKRTDRRRERRARRRQQATATEAFEDAAVAAPADADIIADSIATLPDGATDRLNPIERLGGLIVCPARTLRLALMDEDWAVPVAVYALVLAVVAARQVGSGALLAATDVREFLREAPKAIAVMVAIQLAIPWAVQAAALNALARFHHRDLNFVATFAVIGYARLPVMMGALVTVLLSSLGHAGDNVARAFAFGPGALVNSLDVIHAAWANVLSNFNLMNGWGFVLVVIAIEATTKVKRPRAIAYAALYSTLSIVLQNIGFLLPGGPKR